MKFEASAAEIRALLGLGQRNVSAPNLPRPLVERYQWLLGVGRSPAVVPLERGVCSGCHVRLPTMLEHRVTSSLALYTCPHCRRLLFAPGLLEASPVAPVKAPGRRPPSAAPKRRATTATAEGRS